MLMIQGDEIGVAREASISLDGDFSRCFFYLFHLRICKSLRTRTINFRDSNSGYRGSELSALIEAKIERCGYVVGSRKLINFYVCCFLSFSVVKSRNVRCGIAVAKRKYRINSVGEKILLERERVTFERKPWRI